MAEPRRTMPNLPVLVLASTPLAQQPAWSAISIVAQSGRSIGCVRNTSCVAFGGAVQSSSSCDRYGMTEVADICLSLPRDNRADAVIVGLRLVVPGPAMWRRRSARVVFHSPDRVTNLRR